MIWSIRRSCGEGCRSSESKAGPPARCAPAFAKASAGQALDERQRCALLASLLRKLSDGMSSAVSKSVISV